MVVVIYASEREQVIPSASQNLPGPQCHRNCDLFPVSAIAPIRYETIGRESVCGIILIAIGGKYNVIKGKTEGNSGEK
jgi:hypothetical protein